MSFAHGSVLNLAAVSRDCEVSRKTVAGYLEILEDLLLGFRLGVFTKRAKRAVATHPKFYFFDAGISIGEDYPKARRHLLHRGKDRLVRDGVLCLPCEEFLRELEPDRFPA